MNRVILICGTGASGSSAIFEYLNCFNSVIGIEKEMKQEIRKNIYLKWNKDKCKNTYIYKYKLNLFLNKLNKDNTKIIMLNNSLSCFHLKGIELFSNIKVCCVLRDPRSTWIAWQREWVDIKGNKKWSNTFDPVGEFIKSYKRCMKSFYKSYQSVSDKSKIMVINFEDFSLNTNLRNKVINFFNLDDRDIKVNPSLALRDFKKTIFAHKYYSDKISIDRIKEELSEYCHKLV